MQGIGKYPAAVLNIWKQADSNPPLEGNGWKQPDADTLVTDWDSEDHFSDVRTRVALLQKGFGRKTGCLHRCKCKKNNSNCGPGCKSQGCLNLLTSNTCQLSSSGNTSTIAEMTIEEHSGFESGDESGDDMPECGDDLPENCSNMDDEGNPDLDYEVNELMYNVFGDY